MTDIFDPNFFVKLKNVYLSNKSAQMIYPQDISLEKNLELKELIERFLKIKSTLDILPTNSVDKRIKRHAIQIFLHNEMIKICACTIHKGFPTLAKRFGVYFNERFEHRRAMFIVPRRVGKSTSVAMLAALLALIIPNYKIILAAQILAQSSIIFDMIKEFLESYLGETNLISTTKTCLSIWHREGSSTITKLPELSDSSRGLEANLIVADEVDFIPIKHFYSKLVPMTAPVGRSLIGISTEKKTGTGGHVHFHEREFQKNYNHSIPVYRFSKICSDCSKLPPLQQADCFHTSLRNPPSHTKKGLNDMRKIFQAINQMGMFNAEILSILDETQAIFDDYPLLRRCLYSKEEYDPFYTKIAYIGIDPGGFGKSDLAMVCLIPTSDKGLMVNFSLFFISFLLFFSFSFFFQILSKR